MCDFIIIKNNFQSSFNAILQNQNKIIIHSSFAGDSKILVYDNKNSLLKRFFAFKDWNMLCLGVFIYGSSTYEKGLKEFLQDFINNNVKYESIRGHYALLIFNKERFFFFLDEIFSVPIYYNNSLSLISSSFLAISKLTNKLELEKESFVENILMGGVFDDKTYLKNIKKITKFAPLNFIISCKKNEESRPIAFNQHIEIIKDYFLSLKCFIEENKAIAGITAGLDSRLLMALLESAEIPADYYTFWINEIGSQVIIGRKLCSQIKRNHREKEVRNAGAMNIEQLENNMINSCYYNDGQVRLDNSWHESFRKYEYNYEMFHNYFLSLVGLGGEQYRNAEKLFLNKRNIYEWLNFNLMPVEFDNPFYSDSQLEIFFESYISSILKFLGENNANYVSKIFIKKYLNEIINITYRLHRVVRDNQVIFSLAPFADPKLSFPAYNIVDSLGLSFEYEAKMINTLNPGLAKVETDYGFNCARKNWLKYDVLTIMKDLTPHRVYKKIYSKLGNRNNDQFLIELQKKHPMINEWLNALRDIIPEINLDILIRSRSRNKLALDLAFLAYQLKENNI